MAKSLLHRLFGLGRIPKPLRRELEREGLLLFDEGVPMSLHFRKYRSSHLRATGRKGWTGYVALSETRLVAKGYAHLHTSLPLSRVTPENLRYGLRGSACFTLGYEASDFYDDRSGSIEHRLYTPIAPELVERLDRMLK